ncbi:hypothetical protein CROQUDRAFT_91123 [Cronartium quercuum f. sp. fusiforme G11]|uniref:Secreted protein n=1 Tax=Cronartium quercuum f. sp. fusiforme G11 TaxID=708437 RepID=A0A9P6TCV6_9BASI|nr:hypothetical protein CROQUDRAFT_91123 [Cronartium quercuum f. sp. fusiforme G11]
MRQVWSKVTLLFINPSTCACTAFRAYSIPLNNGKSSSPYESSNDVIGHPNNTKRIQYSTGALPDRPDLIWGPRQKLMYTPRGQSDRLEMVGSFRPVTGFLKSKPTVVKRHSRWTVLRREQSVDRDTK